jgi:hypothetical protein
LPQYRPRKSSFSSPSEDADVFGDEPGEAVSDDVEKKSKSGRW